MRRRKFIVAMISVLAMLLVFTIGLVACDPKGGEPQTVDEAYYLSLKSMGWNTYQAAKDIPAGVLLAKSGDEYKLSISLDADDEFTVNKLGSNDKLGSDAVLSTSNYLAEGENGSIKVVKSGAYALTVSGGFVSYSFTAAVEGVQIAAPAATLELGQEYQFAATVQMSDDSETGDITWSTSNAQVASVSESGLVKALAVGNAIIKATSAADTSKFAEYAVQVIRGKVDVQSVTISPEEVILSEGETTTLTAQISPDDATDKLLLWSSDKDSVATVDSDGTVTAIAPGVANITVRSRDGGKEATAKVIVRQPVTHMTADPELTVVAGGVAREVSVNFLPSDATIKDYDVTITSGSQNVTFNKTAEGKLLVAGVKEGSAMLKLTSKDNAQLTAEVNVTVLEEGSPLVGMRSSAQILIDEEARFELVLENIVSQSVTWTVDHENIVSIVSNGTEATVTGLNWGTAHLIATASAEGGKRYTAEADILVSDEWYFIYGVGIGNKDWDWEPYLTDKNLAKKDGVLLEPTEEYGVFSLTRSLTPDQAFQIIFPTVASYTDAAGDWSKGIKDPYTQYDPQNSSDAYVENTKDSFKVTTAGEYAITLDLRGGGIKVSIKLVQLDVTGVAVDVRTAYDPILRDGIKTFVDFNTYPASAPFDDSLIEWSVTASSEQAEYGKGTIKIGDATIEYSVPRTNLATISLTMKGDIEEAITLTVKAQYGAYSASVGIPVLPKDEPKVAVSGVSFEKEHYFLNVNNGGYEWTTTVSASVDEAATVKTLRYSTLDDGITVDPVTGLVTAHKFGTFTVRATSEDDPTKSADVDVTVFSDGFYFVGNLNGDIYWQSPDPLYQSETTLEGTAFEQYAFHDAGDGTHFEYVGQISNGNVFQIVFLGMDNMWTHAITQEYFDEENSANAEKHETYNVKITKTGKYRVTIDLSGKDPSFKVEYIDTVATSVTLTTLEGKSTLKQGDALKLGVSYEPRMFVEESDFVWKVQEGFENYLSVDFDFDAMTATVTVARAPESGTVEIELSVSIDRQIAKTLVVVSAEETEIKPTSVEFEEEHYYFNVNNGGATWALNVKASVNDEATNKGVYYSANYAAISVDKLSGNITAKQLGTFTVTAAAVGDETVTTTCLVTFYSDSFYLVGEIGDLQTFSALSPTATTVSGIFANYAFTMVDETHFYLERQLEAMKLKEGNYDDYEYGFQIAFLGMDASQSSIIKTSKLDSAHCYGSSEYLSARDGNMRVKVTGVYRIELDLSGSTAKWTINCIEMGAKQVDLTPSARELKKDGGATIGVAVKPDWAEVVESGFAYRVEEGMEDYASLSFDFDTLTLSVEALKVEHSEDRTLTVYVSYNGIESSVQFTLVAEHHFVLDHDEDSHFYRCTDEGCSVVEGDEGHKNGEAKVYDGRYHFYLCETYGARSDVGEHFRLDAEGWLDGTETRCEECGFELYDFDAATGAIKTFYGDYEKVKIPEEIGGVQVTTIGCPEGTIPSWLIAFRGKTNLKAVQLPSSVKTIESHAFAYTGLTEVTIYANITYIKNVYASCSSLKKVTIEEGVKAIVFGMFRHCSALSEPIKMPHSLVIISDEALLGTAAPIIWDEDPQLTTIGRDAFSEYQYTSLTLPDTLEELGSGAFSDSNIESIVIPDRITIYNFNVQRNWFLGSKIKHVVFGEGITQLPMNTLFDATELETVVFKSPDFYKFEMNIFGHERPILKAVYFSFGKYHWDNHKFDNFERYNANYFFYDDTGRKYAYYYSEYRPAPGTDHGIFAGAWHYNAEGEPERWDDTPVKEGDDVVPSVYDVQIKLMSLYHRQYDCFFETSGQIGEDKNTLTFDITLQEDMFWLDLAIRVISPKTRCTYGDEYVGKMEWDIRSSVWSVSSSVLFGNDAVVHLANGKAGMKATFTLTFDDDGVLRKVSIEDAN